jgi:hypothetical protein
LRDTPVPAYDHGSDHNAIRIAIVEQNKSGGLDGESVAAERSRLVGRCKDFEGHCHCGPDLVRAYRDDSRLATHDGRKGKTQEDEKHSELLHFLSIPTSLHHITVPVSR